MKGKGVNKRNKKGTNGTNVISFEDDLGLSAVPSPFGTVNPSHTLSAPSNDVFQQFLPSINDILPTPPPSTTASSSTASSSTKKKSKAPSSSVGAPKSEYSAVNMQASLGINPDTDIFDLGDVAAINPNGDREEDPEMTQSESEEVKVKKTEEVQDTSSRWFSISNLSVTNHEVAPPVPKGMFEMDIAPALSVSASSKAKKKSKTKRKAPAKDKDGSDDPDYDYDEAFREEDDDDEEDTRTFEDSKQRKETMLVVEGEDAEDEESGPEDEDTPKKTLETTYSEALQALRKNIKDSTLTLEERVSLMEQDVKHVYKHLRLENKLIFCPPLLTFAHTASYASLQAKFSGICLWNDENKICFSMGSSLRVLVSDRRSFSMLTLFTSELFLIPREFTGFNLGKGI
jgi:hypothetical protein